MSTMQLRVAEGDQTGSFDETTGTQVAVHSGTTSSWWLELSGAHEIYSEPLTVVLWASNASVDSWGGFCVQDFDGFTIDGAVDSGPYAISEWSLY
jgi:hypothetical protein